MKLLAITLLALAGLLVGLSCQAGQGGGDWCTTRNDNASFGSLPSPNVATGGSASVQASGGAGCSVGFDSARNSRLRVQLEAGSPQALTDGAGNYIPFAVRPFTSTSPVLTPGSITAETINPTLTSNYGFPLYFTLLPAGEVPAGIYSATLTVRWYWLTCMESIVGLCTNRWDMSSGLQCNYWGCTYGVSNWGTGEAGTVRVTVTVTPDCTLQTSDINFGSAPLAGSFAPVTSSLSIRCTKGSAYTVGMSMGNQPADELRRMKNSASNDYLKYQIFKQMNGTERWGPEGNERRASETADSGAQSLDGTTFQNFQFRAQVVPEQPTPPAGSYSDNVIVDVRF